MNSDIRELVKRLNVSIEIPDGQSLESIKIRHVNTDSHGTILFNIKPVFHLNIIHFTLLGYIKIFTDAKFNCTIVLQDLITINGDFLDEINTQNEAFAAMDLFFDRARKFSIDTDRLEIIPESGLVRLYNRGKRRFFYDLIKASALADKHFGDVKINSFDHIDSLCCILYESFLKPDFVITGGSELNTIWKDVRKRQNLRSLNGDEYVSPVMLVVPNMYRYDKKELISTLDKNDPFSEDFTHADTLKVTRDYLDHIILMNKHLKLVVSDKIEDIIDAFKSIIYS